MNDETRQHGLHFLFQYCNQIGFDLTGDIVGAIPPALPD
jgi:hypothetical protein